MDVEEEGRERQGLESLVWARRQARKGEEGKGEGQAHPPPPAPGLKSKEPPQTFDPEILASSYPKWANIKGFFETKSVN